MSMGKRIHSIDSLRAVAILSVVLSHVAPFEGFGESGNLTYFLLDTVGQFDVPFFFTTSGYFLATKMDPDAVRPYVVGVVRKLGSLYLFGILAFYVAWFPMVTGYALLNGHGVVNQLVTRLSGQFSPLGVVYYGDTIAPHLWFLTALVSAICLVGLFVRARKTPYLLPVATAFHLVGVVGQNYPMLFEVPFATHDALFFGFFYLALGFHIRSSDWSPNGNHARRYLAAFLLLLAVQVAEQYAIGYVLRDATFAGEAYTTEYTLTTVFLVLTLFCWALSNPDWGKGTTLPKLGEYAVGVYVLHFPVLYGFSGVSLVTDLLFGVDIEATAAWQVVATPLLFVLSLAAYRLTARVGLIELGGSHTPRLSRIRARLGAGAAEEPHPASD